MKKKSILLDSESGFSLVEILASTVLLGIIAVSFIAFFIQSAKTIQLSTTMTDATYVAQQQMEDVYNLSKTNNLDTTKTYLINTEKFINSVCTSDNCFSKTSTDGYYVTIDIKNPNSNQISNILIKVFADSSKTKLEAQMESKLTWKN